MEVNEKPIKQGRSEYKLKNSSYQVIKEQRCVPCNQNFNTKDELINLEHILQLHDGKLYGCNQCEIQFNCLKFLRNHIRTVHENLTFNCDACIKKFTQKFDLKKKQCAMRIWKFLTHLSKKGQI